MTADKVHPVADGQARADGSCSSAVSSREPETPCAE
jgi:hypothetical protein